MNRNLKAEIVRKYGVQYFFAQALGIRENTVSAVVRGSKEIPAAEKQRWAENLGVPVKKLFAEEKTNA